MKKYLITALTLAFFASCTTPQTEKVEEKTAATTSTTASTEAPMPKGYQVGDVATDFSLKNIDDQMISLANYPDAKGFVVIFTCNHCPFAKAYEDRIVAFDKMYKEKGYPVIAINPNDPTAQPADSFELMKERAKEKGFTFPYLMDEGQKIYPQYGATKTPHVYVLQKEDKGLVVKYIGAIDDNHKDANAVTEKYLEDAVNALLEGKEVKTTSTKAIGCSIKTAKKA